MVNCLFCLRANVYRAQGCFVLFWKVPAVGAPGEIGGFDMQKMKYLECSCCGFLAVIPEKDKHDDLLCPFCYRTACKQEYEFEIRTAEEFKELAELDN